MFTVRFDAAPVLAHLHHIQGALPQAHGVALAAAAGHLRARAVEAADRASLPSEAIRVQWRHEGPYVGLSATPAGRSLFASEFGTPEERPTGLLRATLAAHQEDAAEVYRSALYAGLLGALP